MIKKGIVLVILMLFLVQLVSAEIMISQPNALYSLGDDFNVDLEVSDFEDGYFDVDLKCSNESSNLYHGVLSKKTIKISRELIPLYIGEANGICYIQASYGEEVSTSQDFEISKDVEVVLEIEELNYRAGSNIVIKGKATKPNNELLGLENNGFIEVNLGEEIKASGSIENGRFDINFSTQDTMEAGSYDLIVKAYDKDGSGNVLNIGETKAVLSISQQPGSVEIAMKKQVVNPGENISIIPVLKDMSGKVMNGEIVLEIKDSLDRTMYEGIINSNQEVIIILKEDHEAGYSRIIGSSGGITGEKVFDVKELAKIDVEIQDGFLKVTNIGNVVYDKAVEIEIGGETSLLDLNLPKGEEETYSLSAPNGEYQVKVSDGLNLLHQDGVILTGNSIGVAEVKDNLGIWLKYSLVWLFILGILGFALFVMFKNNVKRDSYAFPVEKNQVVENVKEEKVVENKGNEQGTVLLQKEKPKTETVGNSKLVKGEQVLVLNGQKQNAGVVAIKIKNQLTPDAKQNLNNALEGINNFKPASCLVDGYMLLIFSPLLSRSLKNEEAAVNAAVKIDETLTAMNKKFKDKIEYNIGVNSGEIINKIENNNLKFTNISPTINIAKKVADVASLTNANLLLSKDIREKTMSNIKVDKAQTDSSGLEVFTINRIVNEDRNKEFISDFLKRNKK